MNWQVMVSKQRFGYTLVQYLYYLSRKGYSDIIYKEENKKK